MKRLFTVAILLTISAISYGQKAYGLRAGANASYVRHADVDLGKSIGYYAGFTFQDKVTDGLFFMTDLYFLDQKNSDLDLSVKSINMALGVKLYPAKEGFHFAFGPEIGHTIGISVDGEKDTETEKEFRFNYFAGVGYDLAKGFGVQARYVGTLFDQQQGYDFNLQAGLTYRFGNGD